MSRTVVPVFLILLFLVGILVSLDGRVTRASAQPLIAAALGGAEPGPIVRQAFDILLDNFVIAPKSSVLLQGGWDGALTSLRSLGVQDLPSEQLVLSGDRAGDWQAFVASYPLLASAAAGKIEPVELDQAIIRGMTTSLHSSHTEYLLASEVGAQDGHYGGVGLQNDAALVVVEVFDGSPAASAGVQVGDRLVAVDDTSVEGWTSTNVARVIRGPIGSTVELKFQRVDAPDPLVFSIARAEIVPPSISWGMLEEGPGHLRFSRLAPADAQGPVQTVLTTVSAASPKSLIVDLRGNLGGSADVVRQVVSHFVAAGPIYQQTNRAGQQQTISVSGSFWGRSVPIVVLVDQRTKSAAELLASALRENGAGILIGTKTAGAVASGRNFPLSDGSVLQVTVLTLISGQGKILEGVGLEPDQIVELDPTARRAGRDTQLEAARDYLRQKAP